MLNEKFGITPLLYGSVGLEYLTGESLSADDIDILIPNTFLTDRWRELVDLLDEMGYRLTDEREHSFERGGVSYSYAQIEELSDFAGISPSDIEEKEIDGVRFKSLDLEQYFSVYSASARDGYRRDVRGKKDRNKLLLIKKHLSKRKKLPKDGSGIKNMLFEGGVEFAIEFFGIILGIAITCLFPLPIFEEWPELAIFIGAIIIVGLMGVGLLIAHLIKAKIKAKKEIT